MNALSANQLLRNDMLESPSGKPMPDVVKTLLLAYESLIFALRPYMKAAGLTEPQWRVLHELKAKTPMIASELAANTFVRASSLSRILRDLESRDLVVRAQQFEDLRKTLVSITDHGRKEIATIEARYVELLDKLQAAAGAEAITSCMTSCTALVNQLASSVDFDDE